MTPASRKATKTAPSPFGEGAVSRSMPNASDVVAKQLPGKRAEVGQRLAPNVGGTNVVGRVIVSGPQTFTLRPDGAPNETLNGITLGPRSPIRDLATAAPRAKRKNAEHSEQALLMQWLAALPERQYPGARWAFAVPNAARRGPALAAMMKREGLRKGAPDVVVPAPLAVEHWALGPLWIEMKDPAKWNLAAGMPTPDQKAYHAALAALGYNVAVCYGFEAAQRAVEAHYREALVPNEFAAASVYKAAGARYFSPNPHERKRHA